MSQSNDSASANQAARPGPAFRMRKQWLGGIPHTFGRFLSEWVKLVSTGGSVTVKVVKGFVSALAALIWAALKDSSVRFTFIAGEGSKEMVASWPPSFGAVALIAGFAIWAAIAFGIIWTRFLNLKIGNNLVQAPESQSYCLPIENVGFADARVPVYLTAVADSEGLVQDAMPQRDIELRWPGQDGENSPMLSRGVRYEVLVLTMGGVCELGQGDKEKCIDIYGLHGDTINIGRVSLARRNKLWIGLAIRDHANVIWFSVAFGAHPFNLETRMELPTFLAAERGMIARAVVWLGRQKERVVAEWNRVPRRRQPPQQNSPP